MKTLLLVFIFSLFTSLAYAAAPTYENSYAITGGGTSITFSYTTAGTNRWMGLCFLTVSTATHDAATYNAVAASSIGNELFADANTRLSYWGLVNPASGTNTVELTRSTSGAIYATVTSWTDVNQSTPLGTPSNNAGTYFDYIVTTDVTSASGETVTDCFGYYDYGSPRTLATLQTGRVTYNAGGDPQVWQSSAAGGATVTMGYTWDVSGRSAGIIGVGLKPLATTVTTRRRAVIVQ